MRPLARFVLAVALLGCVSSAHAFPIDRHYKMTEQVLAAQGVPFAARHLIALGSTLPDIDDCVADCYCMPPYAVFTLCSPAWVTPAVQGPNHFDNNMFYESMDRINANIYPIMDGMYAYNGQWHAAAKTLIRFGRLLHTVEDFYAHSSYLEINLAYVQRNGLAALPIWEGQPYVGTPWWITFGYVSDLRSGYVLSITPAGQHSHEQLAKDTEYMPEGGRLYAGYPGNIPRTYYGAVSGDFALNRQFLVSGLAPRHVIRAYNALFSDGTIFMAYPPWLAKNAARDPNEVQRSVTDFFNGVGQDPMLIALAQEAQALNLMTGSDSSVAYPAGALDADGVPIPGAVAVDEALARPGELALAVSPNPVRESATLRFRLPAAVRAEVAVFDLAGRRVATPFDAEGAPGWNVARWGGLDAAGRPVAPGVYLVSVRAAGRLESKRLVISR